MPGTTTWQDTNDILFPFPARNLLVSGGGTIAAIITPLTVQEIARNTDGSWSLLPFIYTVPNLSHSFGFAARYLDQGLMLAVGAPFTPVGSVPNAGVVWVYSRASLTSSFNTTPYALNSPHPTTNGYFGMALSSAANILFATALNDSTLTLPIAFFYPFQCLASGGTSLTPNLVTSPGISFEFLTNGQHTPERYLVLSNLRSTNPTLPDSVIEIYNLTCT